MSFSAIMDEMTPIKAFEAPTRPVTPTTDPSTGKTRSYIYHSESVANALNKLSKDLSGVCDAAVVSADPSAEYMPPLLNDMDDKLHPSSAFQHFTYDLKMSDNLNNVQQLVPSQPQLATSQASSSSKTTPIVASVSQPKQPHNDPQTRRAPLNRLSNFYNVREEPMTVDPVVLSPSQGLSPPAIISPVPQASAAQPSYSPLAFIYSTFSPSQATTSSSATSTPSLAIPSAKILSPTPSTPDLLPEDAETEDEAEYQPTPQRLSTLKRSTAPPMSRPKTRTAPAKPQIRLEPMYPVPTTPQPSTSSMPPVLQHHPNIYSVPVAPDAEANSDYQGSDRGSPSATPQQASYTGGPARERVSGKQARGRRGSGGGNHPYKQKQQQSLGTGRQLCTYISPYDGWKCEQVLGRSYDVPRHMEVHAKEEYELVLTGRLHVHHSLLFDTVTEANVYVCLVCRKDFSRKDAMQRHIRNAAKMTKAKHRAEMKASLKKRIVGVPINPPPNAVPFEILQRHRHILEKLKVEAQELGQDITDWDIENMIPQVGPNTDDMLATPADAPGIPVGRRVNNKVKIEDIPMDTSQSRSTRAAQRGTVVSYDFTFEESESDTHSGDLLPNPPRSKKAMGKKPLKRAEVEAEEKRPGSPRKSPIKAAKKGKGDAQEAQASLPAVERLKVDMESISETSSDYPCDEEKNYASVEEEDPMDID